MKKLFIALIMGLSYTSINACDICGLGTSNNNPFLFPQLSKNYISLNYLHRQYHIHSNEGLVKETINTMLVSAQFSINQKLQIRCKRKLL